MKRSQIPYIASPDDYSCALACHAMVASVFIPGTTINDIAKIVDWQPGYAVWAFRFWKWLMERGVRITDMDLIDYDAWARDGKGGLRRSVPQQEFEWYDEHTKDLEALSRDVRSVMSHPLLTYIRQKPTWDDLVEAVQRGAVCEVVLDSHTLDGVPGFELHRVVVLEVTSHEVVFHDPRPEPESMPSRRVSTEVFKKAWLDAVTAPELCIYER